MALLHGRIALWAWAMLPAFSASVLVSAADPQANEVPPTADVTLSADEPSGFQQDIAVDKSDRMTVPVRINGSEAFPFVVDTGAERTVIANELGERLALAAGPKLALATITGPATARSFVIENLAINTINVPYIEAPGLAKVHLGAYGLLGIDSLEDHKILLDFTVGKMDVLPSPKKRRSGKLEQGMIIVTAMRRAGRMILSNAEIDGVKIDIILDTGAQSSMGNFALRDRLRKRHRHFDYLPVQLRSVTGEQLAGDFTQIRAIDVGGVTITNLPITFADNYAFKALKLEHKPVILLGMDALKLFDRVMIDFTNRRVGFDMPKGADRGISTRLARAD
jgi:predicted aspartyl protease